MIQKLMNSTKMIFKPMNSSLNKMYSFHPVGGTITNLLTPNTIHSCQNAPQLHA